MELPRPDFLPEMSLAITAALAAGERTLEIYQTDFKVTEKEAGELVTGADVESDALIHKTLAATQYPILSEESADNMSRLSAPRVWIVDPLDGTADFVEKTGEFAVMIALVENHEPVLGAVYAPAADLLYIAEKGKGAFRLSKKIWERLQASDVAKTSSARAVVSKHHFFAADRAVLDELKVRKFIQKGSAGLKIVDVAQGSADCYFTSTNKIKQWDTAAAYCLIKEAGGEMTDMKGGELVYNIKNIYHQNGVLVTNGLLHQAVVQSRNI
ncbi:MAG: 3'(2'),5'-bisphosphate nucleotidase CysQ [Patescibacteria group bacterium]